jgi:hypothetical protein
MRINITQGSFRERQEAVNLLRNYIMLLYATPISRPVRIVEVEIGNSSNQPQLPTCLKSAAPTSSVIVDFTDPMEIHQSSSQ